jgi:prophage regulatory protein
MDLKEGAGEARAADASWGGPTQSRLADRRLIRLPEVERLTGLKKTQIYELLKKKEFPRPVKHGRLSLWEATEVEDWIALKISLRDDR